MIEGLYRDEGTTRIDGEEVPYQNHAHLWWVRFTSGATRPATETELELWQKIMEMTPIYQAAIYIRQSDGSYTTEISGVIISKVQS